MQTITFELTSKMLEAYEVTPEQIADACGYNETIKNPDYVPAQGSPTINDPDHVPPEDYDPIEYIWPQVANPDHVEAVGEPNIANVSRIQWLAPVILNKGLQWCIEQALKAKKNLVLAQLREIEKQPAQIAETLSPAAVTNIVE